MDDGKRAESLEKETARLSAELLGERQWHLLTSRQVDHWKGLHAKEAGRAADALRWYDAAEAARGQAARERDGWRERAERAEARLEQHRRGAAPRIRREHVVVARLAAIRQRAGDITGAFDAARMGEPGWMQRILAWVLGDDAPEAVEGAHKLGTNSEPTTAEAFATVRGSISLHQHDDVGQKTEATAALLLLERRVVAMADALHKACPRCCGAREYWPHCSLCGDSTNDHACPDRRPCDHAIHVVALNAPPAFTLEEIRAVLIKTGIGPAAREHVEGELSALRRTP